MAQRLKLISNESVQDKLNDFLNKKRIQGVCDKTISTYECHLKRILPLSQDFKSVSWDSVVLDINTSNLAPYTKVSYLRSLKCFQKFYNIPITYTIPKIETVKQTYSDQELKALTDKPAKTFASCRTRAMVLLVLDTGMRSSSLRNIKISDLQDHTVLVRHTKTHKVQLLPFGDTTYSAIRQYLKSRCGSPEDYLFCSVYGEKLTENALKNALVRYATSCGVSHHSWHLLRHTFSKKFLLDCNQSPFMLQQMLGHSSLEMSKHYCNIFNHDLINSYSSPVETMHKHKIRER